jgi:hypothetical protein
MSSSYPLTLISIPQYTTIARNINLFDKIKRGDNIITPRALNKQIPHKRRIYLMNNNYTRNKVDWWLAGFQPVRITRAVLSMVSAYDDARVSKRA